MKYSTGKLGRWKLPVSNSELGVIHCTGIKYQAADAILQVKTPGTDYGQIEDNIPVLCITPSKYSEKKRPV